jgi:acetyl esterase/lipase
MNRKLSALIILAAFIVPATYASWCETYSKEISVEQQSNTSANPQPAQERRRSFREIVMMPVVYKVPGMDQVKVQKDLKYTNVDDPNLKMDVYIPPGLASNARRPAVVFIHGGAGAEYKPKDWGFYISWGKLIAASGMVGVTFTHRLGYPKPMLAQASSDVTDAINYIRKNADSLNIDKDRICLAAYSAGGPMLILAMRNAPEYVRCLVAFYAFMDVQQSDLHRANETPEMVKKFSPITYLADSANKLPPIFIARAGRDEIPTMNDSIDRFIGEAIARNVNIDFSNHAEGVHGFDNQNDDERSREIIRRAIEFMKTHLGLAPTKL